MLDEQQAHGVGFRSDDTELYPVRDLEDGDDDDMGGGEGDEGDEGDEVAREGDEMHRGVEGELWEQVSRGEIGGYRAYVEQSNQKNVQPIAPRRVVARGGGSKKPAQRVADSDAVDGSASVQGGVGASAGEDSNTISEREREGRQLLLCIAEEYGIKISFPADCQQPVMVRVPTVAAAATSGATGSPPLVVRAGAAAAGSNSGRAGSCAAATAAAHAPAKRFKRLGLPLAA